ncbi:MAG: aminoacyl-tRNA hydrolase [Acidobacteria bacterium]|nr:aminoacyl-tRNA hydrolase [Acidobacteriota bacterium]
MAAVDPLKVIVGLGNPESRYGGNRHNVGFWIVDLIAEAADSSIQGRSQYSYYCRLRLWGTDTLLAKPQTFMNRSGIAVREILQRWQVSLSEMLIVYDDFALPLGKIRLRPSGSSSGHRGMESIIAEVGTNEIPRLRFGIGPPGAREAANFVLSDFSSDELPAVQQGIDRALQAIRSLWENGMMKTMSLFNRDPLEESPAKDG